MLQRIQTVYMALALIALILFNFFSLATFNKVDSTWVFSPYGVSGEGLSEIQFYFQNAGGIVVNVLALVLIVMISQFKKRNLQMRLGHIVYFGLLVVTVALYLNLSSIRKAMESQYGTMDVSYNFGTYLPVIAIAFIILANKAIKKDEKLVKSLDRIR